ncbi:MAG: DUF167 domain-containing protein [Planctomycetota bacterium]
MVPACLEEAKEGVLIQVKALAAAKRNELRGIENGRLRIATTAAPEKGKANKAIEKFLADTLGLPARDLELIRGETHPQKTFLPRGASLSEVAERLQNCLK